MNKLEGFLFEGKLIFPYKNIIGIIIAYLYIYINKSVLFLIERLYMFTMLYFR